MVLAKQEEVIKEWSYATARAKGVHTDYKLTVTNKRLVSSARSSLSYSQQEIPLNTIKSISGSHEKKSPVGAILLMILGIVAIVVGFVVGEGKMAITLPVALVGVILVIIGIVLLKQGAFTLVVTTAGTESSGIAVGAVKWFGKGKKHGRVKIKVDNKVADEIIETLGAIVIDYKD